jgi:uncharacterized repeat protein (TIGR01451 family)
MKRTSWLLAACLLGGLMALVFVGGLQGPARAEGATSTASAGDVVINEVFFNPSVSGESAHEWVELYNTTSSPITLTNWTIADGNTSDTVPEVMIPPYGFAIVAASAVFSDDYPGFSGTWVHVGATIGSGLNNGGDSVTLRDESSTLIDGVSYGSDTAYWDCSGYPCDSIDEDHSMERDPAGTDTDGPGDFVELSSPTPGSGNVTQEEADLVVVKTGPITAEASSIITYHITVSNTGQANATGSLLTDTLPSAVEFVTQTSAFAFSEPGGVLFWEMGDLLTGTQHLITVTARVTDSAAGPLTNYVSATTTASESVTSNNSDDWTTTVGEAGVLISAVLYDGYQASDRDEAVQLINVGTVPVDLTDWELCKNTASGLSCRALPSATISPSDRIWLARDALSFTVSFGYAPDYELASWLSLGLSNSGDEVVLRDDTGGVIDTVVFENGDTGVQGWSGLGVDPYSVGRAEGQILYRVPDEATGLPAGDTNAATDWIQYTDNVTYGRRVLYPGWDLDPLFWPLTATEAATVVVGIAPDNAFDVVSQTIARAQRTISIEVYSLRHPEVVTALVQKAQEGVSVTVLLEGRQAVVSQSDESWQQELWACREIEAAGGRCWFMIHDTDQDVFNRYDYLHAKFIVVDDEWVLISSQNLTESGFPSDDKSNGTGGSRGVVFATDAPSVVARAKLVFALDADAAHHNDLLRWSSILTGTYGPPVVTYTPRLTVTDYASVTVDFAAPLVVGGTYDFELFTAPEAALRQSDALLGLVGRAGEGDAVYVEQMYDYADWGDNPADDPNMRLEAYIAAARRGATVRILLNKGTFGGPNFGTPNTVTVAYVSRIAWDEDLDLEIALGDPTHYGIHNKMVLVWLDGTGGYAHIGSINGSEGSSKVNREMAIQVGSDEVYAYLKAMFDQDWQWSRSAYLPLAMQRYTAPTEQLLITEVDYSGSCEWVEIYNPAAMTVTLTGFKIGDAQNPDQYEGMYIFPAREMAPGEVIVVAGDATLEDCNPAFMTVHYEMWGTNPSVPNLDKDPYWGKPDWHFGLSGAGDEILLLDPLNRPVDVVVYGAGSYPGVTPHPLLVDWRDTLERIPADVDTDDCSHDFEPGGSPNNVRFQ